MKWKKFETGPSNLLLRNFSSAPVLQPAILSRHNMNGNGQQQAPSRGMATTTISPLASGVTVTHAGDTLTRQQTQTNKYVTRPQTPVTLNANPQSKPNFALTTMTLPAQRRRRDRLNDEDDAKFTVQPPPTVVAYPSSHDQHAFWQSSLPRLVRHLPAPQQQVRDSSTLASLSPSSLNA